MLTEQGKLNRLRAPDRDLVLYLDSAESHHDLASA